MKNQKAHTRANICVWIDESRKGAVIGTQYV